VIRKLTSEHRSHIISARDLETSEKRRQVLDTHYDACVIGSGPGGAVAAATLVQAGLKVLLVEKGPFIPQEQINFRVLDMSNSALSGKRARRQQHDFRRSGNEAKTICF
jgi:choline dehydrogenase-like flavoprotein